MHTFPRRSPPGGSTLLDSSCIYAMLSFDRDADEDADDSTCRTTVAANCTTNGKVCNGTFHYQVVQAPQLSRQAEETTNRTAFRSSINGVIPENCASWSPDVLPQNFRENLNDFAVKDKTAFSPSARLQAVFDSKQLGSTAMGTLPCGLVGKPDSVRRRYSCGDQLVATWWSLLGRAATFTDLKCLSKSLSQLCCSMTSSAWTKRNNASTASKPCFGLAAWHLTDKPESGSEISPDCDDCADGLVVSGDGDDDCLKIQTSVHANHYSSFPPSDGSDRQPASTKNETCVRLPSAHSTCRARISRTTSQDLAYRGLNLSALASDDHASVHNNVNQRDSQCASEDQEDDPAGSYITLKMVGLSSSSCHPEVGNKDDVSPIDDQSGQLQNVDNEDEEQEEEEEEENVFCEVNLPLRNGFIRDSRNAGDVERSALTTYLDMTVGACSNTIPCRVQRKPSAEKTTEALNGYVPMELPSSESNQSATVANGTSAQLTDAMVVAELMNCHYVPMNLPRYVTCIPDRASNNTRPASGRPCQFNSSAAVMSRSAETASKHSHVDRLIRRDRQSPLDDLLCMPSVSSENSCLLPEERPLRRSSSVVESSSSKSSSSRRHSNRLLRFIRRGKSQAIAEKKNLNSSKESYSEGNLELARSRTDFVIANKSPDTMSRSVYLANHRLPSPNYPPPPLPEEGAALHLFSSSFHNGRAGVDLASATSERTTPAALRRTGAELSKVTENKTSSTGVRLFEESPVYHSTTVPYANLPNGLIHLSACEGVAANADSSAEPRDAHSYGNDYTKTRLCGKFTSLFGFLQ